MDDPIGRWLLIIALAVLAFGCKLLSSALKHVNEAKLRALSNPRLTALLDAPDGARRALSLIRMASLLLFSMLLCQQFAKTLGQAVLTAALTTPVCAIFLSLTPSFLGVRHADTLARVCSPLYRLIAAALKPFTFVNDRIALLLLRLMGDDPTRPKEEVTEEEIRAMVDIGEESGTIEGAERDMIENVFDFGDLTAADCMVHRTDMTALWVGDSEEEIVKTISDTGLSRFPVYDEDIDDVVGILFARDFFINAGKADKEKKPLRALLRDAYFVPETVKADTLLRNMQHAKTHMAIVVDEYGGVSGLVTMEDLLEEIVGDIYDEFDPTDEAEIKLISPGVYRVDGAATLDALNEALNISLPENEDYDTLGGLFLSRFTEIPEDGTTPETDVYVTENLEKPEASPCDTLHIKVEKLTDRRVERALVTKGRYEPNPNPQAETEEE